jgi:hypothetical protein
MAIKGQASPTSDLVASSTTLEYIKCLKNGTLSVAQFGEVMSLEGRVFHVQGGSVTSPITFGAGSIDTTEPDLFIYAPAGTTIIPLEVLIAVETYGTTLLWESMIAIGNGGAVGTVTSATPVNMNLGHGNASRCTVGVASNNDSTYFTTTVAEIWRATETVAVTLATADDDSTWQPANHVWRAKDAGYYPIVHGAGGLMAFSASQAGTGFVSAKWIELPTAWLS